MTGNNELEEDLDDPISLTVFEDMKISTSVTEYDPSEVIDLGESTDDESTYTSSYGKRDFVLPVTFFDISRNVRLLNKCKPMSIKVVDYKQHPTYYSKYIGKIEVKKTDDFLKVDKKVANKSETKPNNAENINTSGSTEKTVKKQRCERKHSDAFYEQLKKRKERKKQTALSSLNLSKVDFKRNKGLIGLKITESIFEQIVDTENTLNITKKKCDDKTNKEKSENHTTKTNSAEDKSVKACRSVVEKPSTKIKSRPVENKLKGKSDSDSLFGITKNNSTEDKIKDKSDPNTANTLVKKKSKAAEEKANLKNVTNSELVKTKSKPALDKGKQKNETDIKNALARTIRSSDIRKAKEKSENSSANALAGTKSNVVDKNTKKNDNSIKEIGAILDNFGTSVLPLQSTNNCEPKNVNLRGNENTSVKSHDKLPQVKDKQENNESDRVRCSMKSLSENITEKVSKQKHNKCDNKYSSHSISNKPLEQKPNETTAKDDKKVPKLSLKRSNDNTDNFYISPDRVQCKSAKKTDADKFTENKKADEARDSKDTSVTKIQERAISPVIPFMTLNVSRTSIPLNVYTKDFISNQMPGKTSKIVECKFSNKGPPFTHVANIKTGGPTLTPGNVSENRLSDQNLSNKNPTNGTTAKKSPISSPSSENTPSPINQTIRGRVQNQTHSNLSQRFIRQPYFGNNAIILMKPASQLQTNMQKNQGQPIQTVINNRPQYQPMPMEARQIRCQVAPRFPTPNSNNLNYAQPRPMSQCFPQFRMPTATAIRGMEMGLNCYGPQNPGFPCPTGYRFPPPPPPPGPPPPHNYQNSTRPFAPTVAVPQVSKNNILLGTTKTGELIKKINIVARPTNTDKTSVTDKEMMLAELNNAMMSPELTGNNPEDKLPTDLKRNVDPRPSKPCPLSKKNNNADLNKVNVPKTPPSNVGYSPPILPILTYKETFEILSQNVKHRPKSVPERAIGHLPFKINTRNAGLNISRLDNNVLKRKMPYVEDGQDKAKKITYEDYKKRVTKDNRIDVSKIWKLNELKNPVDDYNQDQGYDSDSTVKL